MTAVQFLAGYAVISTCAALVFGAWLKRVSRSYSAADQERWHELSRSLVEHAKPFSYGSRT